LNKWYFLSVFQGVKQPNQAMRKSAIWPPNPTSRLPIWSHAKTAAHVNWRHAKVLLKGSSTSQDERVFPTIAADLKFPTHARQDLYRNFRSKAAVES
jgi:hypothetical protein